MKFSTVFLALVFVAFVAFVAATLESTRIVRVNSCYDDIPGTNSNLCLSAWEPLVDEDPTNPDNACAWCNCKAVKPVCANQEQAKKLPKNVFVCQNDTAI